MKNRGRGWQLLLTRNRIENVQPNARVITPVPLLRIFTGHRSQNTGHGSFNCITLAGL